jgi:hypothetical protein
MREPVAVEYDSDYLTTAYLAGVERGRDASAAEITALRARVAALEGALLAAKSGLWQACIYIEGDEEAHGREFGDGNAVRKAIDIVEAALRAKGGEHVG